MADYDANTFRIAAYQRGYKWKADAGGLVENLLNTLNDAWRTAQPDYYLQFLTLKPSSDQTLEVIDGQQRLTTLTVFFAVGRAAGWLPGHDFTQNRLCYDLRRNDVGHSLLDRYFYDTAALQKLLATAGPDSWDAFVNAQPSSADVDRQDMHHLFHAAHCIHAFGSRLASDSERYAFWTYVADHARLIVNVIAANTPSETVFANLNDNRKELTDLELVKGLLLTRPARESSTSFRQILELRAAQGRHWDALAQWLAQPIVARVFGFTLAHTDKQHSQVQAGLLTLLRLLQARDRGTPNSTAPASSAANEGRYPVYAYWHKRMSRGGRSAGEVLGELHLLGQLLRDWFDDPLLRNGFGVLAASPATSDSSEILLRQLTSEAGLQASAPRRVVWDHIRKLPSLQPFANQSTLPGADAWPVSYLEHRKPIQELLLLLSVFPSKVRTVPTGAVPFDFAAYHKQKWSLEHIFPQHPDESYRNLSVEDQAELLQLVEETTRPRVAELLSCAPSLRTDVENEELSQLLTATTGALNGIGNLVLLTIGNNAALRNYSFAEKRRRLTEKVAAGAFVPAHTVGVFAKLVPPSATDRLGLWGPQEMEQHRKYILNERAALINYFTLA